MAKKFKKHMMYGDGKEKMANTHKEHLKLKAKGWGHTKPKDSPLDLNQTLVRGAGQSNKQLGGSSSLSAGDWKGELITKPIMDALVGKKLTEQEKLNNRLDKLEKNKNNNNKKNNNNNKENNNNNKENSEENKKTLNLKTTDLSKINITGEEVERNPLEIINDNENEDDVKNTKQKQKNVDVVNVSKKKRNAIQRLFSKDKSRYKKALGSDARRAVNDKMRKYVKEGGSKDDKAYKDLKSKRDENFYRLKRKGLFNDKTLSREEMDDYIAKNNLTRKNNSSRYEGDYYSPLEMNSREKVLRKRSSNPNSYTPFAYKERVGDSTPFYQIEKVKQSRAMANEIPKVKLPEVEVQGNVFDLINQYGDLKVGKAVDNMQLIGDEKPPQLLGASAVSAISDFMQLQKEELFKMKDGVGNASRDRENIISNAKSLSANMNKIGSWMSENIESISEETESKGSSVANTYLRDILITKKTDEEGKPLTTMIVDNNNDLAIKFRDIAETYNLDSINENIFPKSFKTFETLSTAMRSTMDEAIAGLPFNEEGAKALINNALKTQEEILSTIHDEESPLHKILEDFANAYPNANMDFFHIDSPYFNLNDVKPIVKDYALKKLRSQHALYSKKGVDTAKMTAEDIIKKFSK